MNTFPTEGFIRSWNTAASISEVATLFGLDVRNASWRAWALRRQGRVLKSFRDLPRPKAHCADCPTPVTAPRVRCGPCAVAWLERRDVDFARGVDELGRVRHMDGTS